jgi:hypothetical protein
MLKIISLVVIIIDKQYFIIWGKNTIIIIKIQLITINCKTYERFS